MALTRYAGAAILVGAAAVLAGRALRYRPDWYDEPLPDQEDDLFRGLVAGRTTRADYRREVERLAAEAERGRLFVLPPVGGPDMAAAPSRSRSRPASSDRYL